MAEVRVEYGEVTCTNCICAYYNMDELSGDALDSTSNGYDLPNYSSAGSPASGAGVINTARITDNNSSLTPYHQFRRTDAEDCFDIGLGHTIFGWVKVISPDSIEYIGLSAFDNWSLYYQSGSFSAVFSPPSDTYIITHTTNIEIGTWYFVALWVSDGSFHFRVNKVTNSTPVSDTGIIGGSHTFNISASVVSGECSAAFDEWGIAETALTDSQLKQLYNRGYGTTYLQAQQIICGGYSLDVELNACSDDCCGLCAYYACDEASGSLIDSVGNYDLPIEDGIDSSSIAGVVGTARGAGMAGGQFRLDNITEPCFSLQQGNITFWCWAFDNSGSTGFGAFEKGDQIDSNDAEWYVNIIGAGSPNYIEFVINTDTGYKYVQIGGSFGDFDINADEWYFIVAWVVPSEETMYLRVKSQTTPANDVTRSTSYAGSTPVPIHDTFVRAKEHSAITHGLDEMGFASRILTTTEQDSLYNDGNGLNYSESLDVICCANSTDITGIEILQEYFETDEFQQFWLDCCGNPCACEETVFPTTTTTTTAAPTTTTTTTTTTTAAPSTCSACSTAFPNTVTVTVSGVANGAFGTCGSNCTNFNQTYIFTSSDIVSPANSSCAFVQSISPSPNCGITHVGVIFNSGVATFRVLSGTDITASMVAQWAGIYAGTNCQGLSLSSLIFDNFTGWASCTGGSPTTISLTTT